jgi:hypothetical protein
MQTASLVAFERCSIALIAASATAEGGGLWHLRRPRVCLFCPGPLGLVLLRAIGIGIGAVAAVSYHQRYLGQFYK